MGFSAFGTIVLCFGVLALGLQVAGFVLIIADSAFSLQDGIWLSSWLWIWPFMAVLGCGMALAHEIGQANGHAGMIVGTAVTSCVAWFFANGFSTSIAIVLSLFSSKQSAITGTCVSGAAVGTLTFILVIVHVCSAKSPTQPPPQQLLHILSGGQLQFVQVPVANHQQAPPPGAQGYHPQGYYPQVPFRKNTPVDQRADWTRKPPSYY